MMLNHEKSESGEYQRSTAKPDLCRVLYELTGWDDPGLEYISSPNSEGYPKYELSFLLSKMPDRVNISGAEYPFSLERDIHNSSKMREEDYWIASYSRAGGIWGDGKTPEDAVASLAIDIHRYKNEQEGNELLGAYIDSDALSA